jgi:hypothetical protein
MFDDGYSGVVIYFDEVPLVNRLIANPLVAGFTFFLWIPAGKMGLICDPDEFSRRVWLREPEFEVGDEVTVEVEESVVYTETALVAGDSR